MSQLLKPLVIAYLVLGITLSVSGATDSPPQLQIKSGGPAQVVLGWPAPAEDFLLEETRRLSPLGQWLPVAQAPRISDGWCIVDMPCTEPTRFFRLRYEPSALRSTHPAIIFALVAPDGANVLTGQPFPVELRASFNAVLAAVLVRISASGSAEAMLTGRSANPARSNGLMFISSTSQEPFENGLPMSLTGDGSLEVLLGGGQWPFDGAAPGNDVLLERLEVTPISSGELTLSLVAAEAVTSRWAQDGLFFDSVGINPWSSAVTVNVQAAAIRAGDGVRALSTVEAFSQRAQPTPTITPNADGEGSVDLADLVYVRARLGADPALPENTGADVNDDEKVDLLDLVAVRNRLSPPERAPEPQDVRLNEVAPNPAAGEVPWVELKYTHTAETTFTSLELRNGSQQVLLAPGASIPVWHGSFIVVMFDGDKPMEYLGDPGAQTGVMLHLADPGAVFDPTADQCLLYLDGELVDSVAWGHLPERNAVLNTELYPVPSGGSIGRDSYEQDRWVRFATPTLGAHNGLPTPLVMFPIAGGGVLRGETTPFAWVDPRYSPITYELEVEKTGDFQTPLIGVTCYEPGYLQRPGLPPGQYFWRVRPVAGDLEGPWSALLAFEVIEGEPSLSATAVGLQGIGQQAGTPIEIRTIPFFTSPSTLKPPVKDTCMLCLECLRDEGPHAWDLPHHTIRLGICPHEVMHGATAIAQWMNWYYGGNMTQDEINIDIFQEVDADPEGGLGHGQVPDQSVALFSATEDTVVWASDALDLQSDSDWSQFRQDIDAGKPAAAQLILKGGVGTGAVVLMGYMEMDPLGTPVRKVLFLSPLMTASPQVVDVAALASSGFTGIRPHDAPGKGQPAPETNPSVDRDTDGDGLCDFDEEWRFGTKRTKADSDGDGIQDKTEVWSYKFGKGWVPRTPDTDGDGLRAELDPDSDDDGCLDGAEDRDHDGSLFGRAALGYDPTTKSEGETDPFSVDEFEVTLTAERTVLHFKECTHLEVNLMDKEDIAVEDAEVELKMDPAIGSFDASGGPPVTTANIRTGEYGAASSDFCARETEGTVTLTATYKPCPNSKEIKAELKIQILPYDWIFAVQEKAVLTGPALTNEYRVRILKWGYETEGTGIQSTYKDTGFQKVSGYFFRAETQAPGKYIQSITVASAPSVVLRINGTNVSGLTWTRASDQDLPTRWEVEVASPGLERFPRYLEVTTRGGPARRTPLVWWESCQVSGLRNRWYYNAVAWGREFLLTFDRYSHSYQVFFGDGNEDGVDTAWTWPDEEHTSVSFIPVAGVPGYDVGTGDDRGWPPSDWYNHGSGVYESYSNFGGWKNSVAWDPPSTWTTTEGYYDVEKALTEAGPMLPGEFLETIRFKRDYIGDELKELQQRKLDAPQYEIRMLLEE
ncbi:MAG: hypothetical protein Q8Q12_04395 [bacterium]|nr:hypothetical protein [bacterium]